MILTADVWNIFWTGVGVGIAIGASAVLGVFAYIVYKEKKNKK